MIKYFYLFLHYVFICKLTFRLEGTDACNFRQQLPPVSIQLLKSIELPRWIRSDKCPRILYVLPKWQLQTLVKPDLSPSDPLRRHSPEMHFLQKLHIFLEFISFVSRIFLLWTFVMYIFISIQKYKENQHLRKKKKKKE